MFELLLWITAFSFFSVVFVTIQISMNQSKLQIERRILPLMDSVTLSQHDRQEDEDVSFRKRIITPIVQKIQTLIQQKTPKQKLQEMENKLRDAGNPFGLTAINFIVLRVIISAFFILLLLGLFLPSGQGLGKILFLSLFSILFINFYANYYIVAKKKQRILEIEKTMPDFFDMVTISIEAGMGLDSALRRVSKQMEGPLSKEFLYALEDMKLGKSRKQALTDLRNRVSSDFLKSVVSAIIQADQLGIGMSKVLQAQTQRIREQQRQKVKEQAMKAPVKMLIPMVLFIFPTLFIVLLGPAIVQLVTTMM